MKLFSILIGAAAVGSAAAAPANAQCAAPTKVTRATKFQFVGVNQSGAEFGKDTLPGTLGKHYTWPVKSSIDVCTTQDPPIQTERLTSDGRHWSARE